ncbi:MAG: 2-oxoacid:acceptor oxidoreductase subunit alpha [Fervidobacterium sp.]|uniref:2-oxoglutarate ferredoxin oxidoreductase subunit alpha n=1 Tax=Fervidobacterium gondwanense DSM 13020 TaxID=1121883 RepID=A0A1M7SDA4_FERGO|nr:2-oxoacid:acceptor oxidoreductase subunit alpha [Fervidobacterium gondwanense]UXF01216.1 2-oxoacid:ferredoxin oxidoreductase subunit alpha [Fervidobacterium riparium]SHN56460.1 2-oxoglutarate ferredoxin oxidoreductase subunit alpha [Fervidobacterium gondwanense DSM 13020]
MEKRNEISIVLSGAAGQGIQAVEHILTRVAKDSGFHVFATKEYMSRVRGGNNSTEIRIASQPVKAFVNRIDVLVPLNDNAIERLRERITEETIIIGEGRYVEKEKNSIPLMFEEIAESFGNKIYENSVAIGVLAGIINASEDALVKNISAYFSKKNEEVVKGNVNAALKGYEIGKSLGLKFEITPNEKVKKQYLLNGSEAVAKGAIAGGCNFISSYPMSPATTVFTELSRLSNQYGILVDQAEDEIAAANMAIAAWYAGARAMVSTSGGGFALMTEAISLSGMIETPIVVHLGQRPGPATGLPTRTEQGDLNLVLYSGHGDFPRVIYAPGNLCEAYELSAKAFNIADKYQVPVFILTDEYFLDSFYNVEEMPEVKIERYVVKSDENYKRYLLTEDGISPRSIPGYGKGLVRVDSDEHDEYGHITESAKVRKTMVEKRLKKGKKLLEDAVPPKLFGNENYDYLIVAWGSTQLIIREALEKMGNEKVALLHFSQVYPVPRIAEEYLRKAKKVIFVEQNATGQFADLVKLTFGIDTSNRILKYDGFAFSVEELVETLSKEVE